MYFCNDKETDKRLKKYIKVSALIFTDFSLILTFILLPDIGLYAITAILFSLMCAPCIGAISGAVLYIAIDYIKS